MNKRAFTLVEVMITMGILGVIAAFVLPPTIDNVNKMAWNNRKDVFEQKLDMALGKMNVDGKLGNMTSVEFVNELKNYLKIAKTCDADHLTDCFPASIKDEGKNVDVSTLTTGAKLGIKDDANPTVGVLFGDGTSAIVAYEPASCLNKRPYDEYPGQYHRENPKTAQRYGHGPLSNCTYFLYDVTGSRSPNETTKDIKVLNVDLNTVPKCIEVTFNEGGTLCINSSGDTAYSPVEEDIYLNMLSGSLHSTTAGINNEYSRGYANDRWAGAKYACYKKDMRLPTITELVKIAQNMSRLPEYGFPADAFQYWTYWTNLETEGETDKAQVFDFKSVEIRNDDDKMANYGALCVK